MEGSNKKKEIEVFEMEDSEFGRRLQDEQGGRRRITNNELLCRDCINRYDDKEKLGNTSSCKVYARKPTRVLLGGWCFEYRQEKK